MNLMIQLSDLLSEKGLICIWLINVFKALIGFKLCIFILFSLCWALRVTARHCLHGYEMNVSQVFSFFYASLLFIKFIVKLLHIFYIWPFRRNISENHLVDESNIATNRVKTHKTEGCHQDQTMVIKESFMTMIKRKKISRMMSSSNFCFILDQERKQQPIPSVTCGDVATNKT